MLAAVRDAIATQLVTLLVSHGGSLRLVRGFVEGTGIDSFHEMSVPSGGTIEIDTTGLVARIDGFLEREPPADEG